MEGGGVLQAGVGWVVLISSQLFIPVTQHRRKGREGERGERDRDRDRERDRESQREVTTAAAAASMHRWSLLNVSPPPTPFTPPASLFAFPSLYFDLPFSLSLPQCQATSRWCRP